VLAAQRSYPQELAGLWEFPGGKVGDGEDERAAGVRECAEELAVAVELTDRLGPEGARTAAGDPLHLWAGRITAGAPTAVEHAALRWLSIFELYDVAWIEADLPLVDAVADRLRGKAELSTHPGGTP
jgi:8-oxo-dGTP diphosphatase